MYCYENTQNVSILVPMRILSGSYRMQSLKNCVYSMWLLINFQI